VSVPYAAGILFYELRAAARRATWLR